LRPVASDAGADAIEHFNRQTFRIGLGLEHERRNRSNENRLGDPSGSVPADVASNLAAAGGVTHQRGVLEVKRLDHGCEIVGIAVHVVRGGGLARTAVPAPVVRDHPETLLRKEEHLAVPGVRVQRPAVRKRYSWTRAPILVVDFRTVLGGDKTHGCCSFA
jgi:hypothetical protein